MRNILNTGVPVIVHENLIPISQRRVSVIKKKPICK